MDAPSAAVSDLAPTGKLRAAINFGNPVLAGRDATGEPCGISVDLARELARRLDVTIEFVPYDAAGKVVEGLKSQAWDVCFLAIDPLRAADLSFTAPYAVIEGVYLVAEASPVRFSKRRMARRSTDGAAGRPQERRPMAARTMTTKTMACLQYTRFQREELTIPLQRCLWADLPAAIGERFDVVLCTGNALVSFTRAGPCGGLSPTCPTVANSSGPFLNTVSGASYGIGELVIALGVYGPPSVGRS